MVRTRRTSRHFNPKPENPRFRLYFVLTLVRRRRQASWEKLGSGFGWAHALGFSKEGDVKPAGKSWVQGFVCPLTRTRYSGKVGFRVWLGTRLRIFKRGRCQDTWEKLGSGFVGRTGRTSRAGWYGKSIPGVVAQNGHFQSRLRPWR